MEQLRTGVAEFEAHIANLAQVAADRAHLITDMIDQEIKSKRASQRAEPVRVAEPRRQAVEATASPESPGPEEELAEPDGSGQLPANRPTVEPPPNRWSDTGRAEGVDLRADLEAEFVYDGAASGTSQAAETIYKRRGGGIRKRVAALDTPDDELD